MLKKINLIRGTVRKPACTADGDNSRGKRGKIMNFKYLEEYLDYLTNVKGIPGVDCLITREGEEIYRYGKGIADMESGKRITHDQVYNLFSASKPITCAAFMQLVERGKVRLMQPLYEIFPEFKDMQARINRGEELEPAEPVRLVHLMSMTAGFDYNLWPEAMKQVYEETNGRMPTVQSVKAFAKAPLWFQPDTHWEYSVCHDILGAVIEQVSGKKFGEYLAENIFEPLGMKDTGFNRDGIMDRLASLYECVETGEPLKLKKMPPIPPFVLGPEYESGGAGLYSTVEDYTKFIIAMYSGGVGKNGSRILSESAIRVMSTGRLSETAKKDFNWEHLLGYNYGLGVRVNAHPELIGSLSPVGEFGWDGAAGAYVHIDPVNRIGMFYAQHMTNAFWQVIHPKVKNMLYSALDY